MDELDAVADRGYFSSPEILACHEAGITVTLPKPMTSGAKADGRYGRQDFVYIAEEDVYRCPAGERLTYRYTNEEAGKVLRRYWTTACSKCPLKSECTTGPERRIGRQRPAGSVQGASRGQARNRGAGRAAGQAGKTKLPTPAPKTRGNRVTGGTDFVMGVVISKPVKPLCWTQVRAELDPQRYTMASAPGLLAIGRPWRDYSNSERPLKEAIRKLVGRD